MMFAMSISLSGLQAQSLRMHSSAHNVANLLTDDFKSQRVELYERQDGGVTGYVRRNETPGPVRFDLATGQAAGEHSNTDLGQEAVTQITAQRAYEANLIAIQEQNERIKSLFAELG